MLKASESYALWQRLKTWFYRVWSLQKDGCTASESFLTWGLALDLTSDKQQLQTHPQGRKMDGEPLPPPVSSLQTSRNQTHDSSENKNAYHIFSECSNWALGKPNKKGRIRGFLMEYSESCNPHFDFNFNLLFIQLKICSYIPKGRFVTEGEKGTFLNTGPINQTGDRFEGGNNQI